MSFSQQWPVPKSTQARSMVINETCNNVVGTFELHDLLSINTLSGSINITVVPQQASRSGVLARLHLSTASGSIQVAMASNGTPDRVYVSAIKSMSGSINAILVQ